jgi:hypothetical protein
MDRVLVLSADFLLRFQKLTLFFADGFLLFCVDGVTSVCEVVQMIPLPVEQTRKRLLGLLSIGIVEYADVRRSREANPPVNATPQTRPAARPAAPPPPAPAAPARAAVPTFEPASEAKARPAPVAPGPKAAPAPPPTPPSPPTRGSTDDEAAERRREILEA